MLISALLLSFVALIAIAGLTGFGAADSRDTNYRLVAAHGAGRCADDDLVTPQVKHHSFAGRARR